MIQRLFSSQPNPAEGFTLIEILLVIFTFLILSTGLLALVSGLLPATNRQASLLSGSDQARRLVFSIMNEVRNGQVSDTGAYPLSTAGSQSLVFYSNVDREPDIERVRYFVQGDTLMKGVLKPEGTPAVYNSANETTYVVQHNLANGTDPVFYYYDGSYDGAGGSELSEPVSVTTVKLIKAEIRVVNTGGIDNTNSYTVTGSAAIRSLKTNLGD